MAYASHGPRASSTLTLLALGNFVVGMGAFVVIGIITPVADGLGVSKADSGIILTSYAIAYAVLSPVGAALTGTLPRRTVLTAALALFCLGSLLSAFAVSLSMLTASRLLVALGAALYTPLSAGVAVALAAPEERGRALAKVFGGITMAQVVGVPLGAWAAYRFGWHAPFFVVAGLAALCAGVLFHSVPRQISVPPSNLSAILEALRDTRLMLAVTFTATLMAAVYVVFTFFGPLIEASTGTNPETRTFFLILFGLGAVGGNYLGGYLSDRVGPSRTLVLVCLAQMALLPLFSLMPWTPVLFAAIIFVWSSFCWCFMAPQQSRLVALSPEAPSLALALNAAMIYVGIAIGSGIGGSILGAFGLAALGGAAGLGALVALLHLRMTSFTARA